MISIPQALAESAQARSRTRRLRILFVISAYYPAVRYGGPIRVVHGLAAALVRRGHEVHVYTTSVDGNSDLDVPLDRPVDLEGVQVHYFRVPALRRLWWAPALGRKLRGSVAGFDVVHIHAVFLWPMWAAARVAARARVPYVVSPHGMLIRDVMRRKNRWVKKAWVTLIERRTLAGAGAVHVTAPLEGAELAALGLAAPSAITEVPLGVDLPAARLPLAETPIGDLPPRYVLFLSRISWKKGLDRLIAAWQQIEEVPLVIAGNDDEGYRPKLQALARELGVADRVIFLGAVSDAHKWALFERADVFVLPSYSENFGVVVAEAMAMGCPVVVSPETGIASLICAERAGIVTRCEPPELAAAVARLLADPARRAELGRRGREAVRARLSWPAIAEQMERLYGRVVQGSAYGQRARAVAR